MAEAVVSLAVETLGNSLLKEATFLHGVRAQVEELRTELNRMRCFLKDADRRQDEDESIRNWVSEIREAAYKAQGVIDAFASKQALRSSGPLNLLKRYSCICKEWRELHLIGSEIETIKSNISAVGVSLHNYGIRQTTEAETSSSKTARQWELRRSYSHINEDVVVGFEKDTNILVTNLVDEEKLGRVVAICGMGGLGKTTLAKRIYRHKELRHNFKCFAWVYISQQFQTRKIWEEILFKVTSATMQERNEISHLNDGEVAKRLYEVQLERKCLVILDDIWRKEAWDLLSPAFPSDTAATGSKILLTTRNREVALHVNMKGFAAFIHEMKVLDDKSSWELFQKKAFSRGIESESIMSRAKMEELGKNIVRKCGGLPLAIVAVGGLLSTKDTLSEWEKVYNDISWYWREGNTQDDELLGVAQVLALSYLDLPYQLKHCFLYLSHFPEDFEISTRKLIQMWVAEGFVLEMRRETMEEVGMHYLNELIDRGMVQVGTVRPSGRIKTCRLHDLMRELCIKIAERENFFKIIEDGDDYDRMQAAILPVHRLVILPNASFIAHETVRYRGNSNLRSLVLHNEVKDKRILFKLPASSLRVLAVENPSILDCISNFGQLNSLTFLYFPMVKGRVSSSIGKFRCLQTLDFRFKKDLVEEYIGMVDDIRIPDVIWMMEQLRHLYFPQWKYVVSNGKLRLGNLRKLQTLMNLRAFPGVGKEVMRLTDLIKLKVICYSENEYLEICKVFNPPNVIFNRLQSLSFQQIFSAQGHPKWPIVDWISGIYKGCPCLSKMNAGVELGNLPSSQHFPENIRELTLENSNLMEDPMPMLEKLPSLMMLKLGQDSFLGKKMVCSGQGFPQLRSLVLQHLYPLEEWRINEEAMPNLWDLQICFCTSLRNVIGLGFITTLLFIEFRDVPELHGML